MILLNTYLRIHRRSPTVRLRAYTRSIEELWSDSLHPRTRYGLYARKGRAGLYAPTQPLGSLCSRTRCTPGIFSFGNCCALVSCRQPLVSQPLAVNCKDERVQPVQGVIGHVASVKPEGDFIDVPRNVLTGIFVSLIAPPRAWCAYKLRTWLLVLRVTSTFQR